MNQLLTALRNADAAGDVAAATRLAQIIKDQQGMVAPAQPPQEATAGVGEALIGGAKRIGSDIITGVTAPFVGGEEAAQKGIARQEQITERPGASLEEVQKKYKEEGAWPAIKEAISQIPSAITEQAPFLATMWAGGKAGAALPGTPQTKVVTGFIGAALAPFLAQSGSNIQRQVEEQVAKGEDPNVSMSKAYGGATAQAALDVFSLQFGLGRLLGIKPAQFGTQQAEKLAKEKLALMLAKGTGKTALAEIPTEMTQQLIERAQAGLDLTSPEAVQEYLSAGYTAGLISPIGGPVRALERSDARNYLAAKEEQAKQAMQQSLDAEIARINEAKFTEEEKQRKIAEAEAEARAQRNAVLANIYTNPGKTVQEIIDEATGVARPAETKKSLEERQKALETQLNEKARTYKKALNSPSGVFAKDPFTQQEYELTTGEWLGLTSPDLVSEIESTTPVEERGERLATDPVTETTFTDMGIGRTAKLNTTLKGLDPLEIEDNRVIRNTLDNYLKTREAEDPRAIAVQNYLNTIPSTEELENEPAIRDRLRSDLQVSGQPVPVSVTEPLAGYDGTGIDRVPDNIRELARGEESVSPTVDLENEIKSLQKEISKPYKGETLVSRIKKLGGIATRDFQDLARDKSTAALNLTPGLASNKGRELGELVSDELLDDFLPPELQSSSPTFDPKESANYLIDEITSGNRVIPYMEQRARDELQLQHDQLAETLYLKQKEPQNQRAAEFGLTPQEETANAILQAESAQLREDQDIQFAQSTQPLPNTGQTSESITSALEDEFGTNVRNMQRRGKLRIVDSVDQLPPNVRNQATPRSVGAFDGEISYIIADRVNPQNARRVLLHEVGEHYGLERMLGRDNYRSALNRLKTLKNTDNVVKNAWNQVKQAYPKLKEGSDPYLKEVMAKVAEEAPNMTLITRLRGLIKNFLTRLGLYNPDTFTSRDLQDLLIQSLRSSLAKDLAPVARAGQAEPSADIEFMEVPPDMQGTAVFGRLDASEQSFYNNYVNRFDEFRQSPRDSLQDMFVKGRINIASSTAGVEEKLIKDYNGAVNDAMNNVRADILLNQALESNIMASQAAEEGKVDFLDNGLAKVVPDENNINKLIQLREQLGQEVGDPTRAKYLVQHYLVGRRFKREIELNAQREQNIINLKAMIVEQRRILRDSQGRGQAEQRNNAEKLMDRYKKLIEMNRKAMTDITDEQIAAIGPALDYANQHPILNQIGSIVDGINRNRIDMLEKAGYYDADTAAFYRSNLGYVPLFRVIEDLDFMHPGTKEYFQGFANLGREYEFKGSERDVDDVLNNMLKQHFWAVNAAVRNNANFQTAKALGMHETVTDPETGTEIERLMTLDKKPEGKAGESVAPVYINGERKFIEYSDPNLAIAIQGAVPAFTGILAWFGQASKIFRLGITANPVFQSYQVVNDAISAGLFSGVKNPFALGKEIIAGFAKDTFNSTDAINKQMARLGIAGGYGKTAKDIYEQSERKFNLANNTLIKNLYDKADKFASKSDLAQRRGIFIQTLLETGGVRQPDGSIQGGNEVLAMNRALNIINWQKRGLATPVRALTHVVPFLNAYIQGMDVLMNALRGKGISGQESRKAQMLFFKTAMTLMALNAMYAMLVAGDDEYDKQDDRTKFRNYFIPGTNFKMPVRAEISFLTKYLPEQTYQYMLKRGTKDEPDSRKLAQGFSTAFTDSMLSPNLFPQLFRAGFEVATNYDFYNDRPLIGMGLNRLATSEQYNERTSQFARWIGASGIVAPINVDHLIRGYTGTLGSTALYLTDATANLFYTNKLPERPLRELPIISPLMMRPEGRDKLNDFYDLKQMSDEVAATFNNYVKLGKGEQAREYRKDNVKLMALRGQINNINNRLKTIRDQRKLIVENPRMSAEVKRERLEKLDKMMNAAVMNVSRLRRNAGL